MRKIGNKIAAVLLTYFFVFPMGLTFCLLRIIGAVKVVSSQPLPRWYAKVLVPSNHPYHGEQFWLPMLFLRQILLHPIMCAPVTMADIGNYYRKHPWFRLWLIPVDRTKKNGDVGAMKGAVEAFNSRARVIIYPEGGRTIKPGRCEELLEGPNGRRIRRFQSGVALLAQQPEVITLPVSVDFNGVGITNFLKFWRWPWMTVTIGLEIQFQDYSREEIIEQLQSIILNLQGEVQRPSR